MRVLDRVWVEEMARRLQQQPGMASGAPRCRTGRRGYIRPARATRPAAAGADGDGRRSSAAGMRQHRQPAAGARRGARARDGAACGDWREPHATVASGADRVAAAVGSWRRSSASRSPMRAPSHWCACSCPGRPMIGLPAQIQIDVQPDLRVLLFTAGVAVLTGVLFGLVPAWNAFASCADHDAARCAVSSASAGRDVCWSSAGGRAGRAVGGHLSAGRLLAAHVSNLRNLNLGFQRRLGAARRARSVSKRLRASAAVEPAIAISWPGSTRFPAFVRRRSAG